MNSAYGITEPKEAPPQLLIDLLEWEYEIWKALPIPAQYWKTEAEFTVVQQMYIAASVPIAIGTAVIVYRVFFWQAKKNNKSAADDKKALFLHDPQRFNQNKMKEYLHFIIYLTIL